LLVGALVLAVASWPGATVVILLVLAIAVVSWRAPRYAFVLALGAFGAEGSVKVLLINGGSPFPSSPDSAGAALLDAALFVSVLGVLAADRGRMPGGLWQRASRWERLVLGGLGAWLVVSVLELPLGDHLTRSLAGLRLTHAYVLCAAAALVAFAPDRVGERALKLLLALLAVLAGYASLRVLIGPAPAEESLAQARGVTAYASHFRAVGSFSGAVGLESFLTPAVAFGLVLGWLAPRWRTWSWTVAALGLVAEFGSYGRTPLVAIGVAVAGAAALILSSGGASRRRQLAVVMAVGVVLAGLSVGTIVAASGSSRLRTRAQGLVNPAGDESLRIRIDAWRWAVRQIAAHPLGRGLGSVGRATASRPTSVQRVGTVTTDDGYLKVALEQGIVIGVLFTLVVVGACVMLARRGRTLSGTRRAVTTAALAGFASFLVLLITTDDIEQPGKVLAWAMLGLALAYAFGPVSDRSPSKDRDAPGARPDD
jgi:O-antigen ligase